MKRAVAAVLLLAATAVALLWALCAPCPDFDPRVCPQRWEQPAEVHRPATTTTQKQAKEEEAPAAVSAAAPLPPWPAIPSAQLWRKSLAEQQQQQQQRVVFCATSGHTGTKFLTSLLAAARGVRAVHEPRRAGLAMAGDALRMCNERPMAETLAARSFKADDVRSQLALLLLPGADGPVVYAETNNMFLKTFYDVVLAQQDWAVTVVVLRRALPRVLRSHMIQLAGYDFVADQVAELYLNTTFSVNAAHAPPVMFPLAYADRIVRHLVDIEMRIQRLVRDAAPINNRVGFVETTLEEIASSPEAGARFLHEGMGLDVEEGALERLYLSSKKFNAKRQYRCIPYNITTTYTKQSILNYLAALPSGFMPLLPSLCALLHKPQSLLRSQIVSVTLVGSASCPLDATLLQRHMRSVLKNSQHALLVGDPSTCQSLSDIMSLASKSEDVTFVEAKEEQLSEFAFLQTISAHLRDASHVLSLRPDEVLSDAWSEGWFLQQAVLSLDPGESLAAASGREQQQPAQIAFALPIDDRSSTLLHAALAIDRARFTLISSSSAGDASVSTYVVPQGTPLPGYPRFVV